MDDVMFLIPIFLTVFGLVFGSFLNVLIYRLPLKMSVAYPASHCPKCSHTLKWYDNIPVLSYLFLCGKCRYCHAPISLRYPLVELSNTVLWLLCWHFFGWSVMLFLSIIVSSIMLVIIFIDLDHFIIMDETVIALLIIGIVSCFFPYEMTIYEKLAGVSVGILLLGLSLLLGKMLKKEAIGGGDIKLVGVIGLFLGFKLALLGLFLAALAGTLIELPRLMLLKKKNPEGTENIIPFGPYLAIGFLASLFSGNYMLHWYIDLLTRI
jgi:leader peptidase (prepilin peptidase)/N-methyltransferase